jgi:hypothetical protein
MSIKRILVLSLAATALSTAAWADDDTYRCGESRCYDDQADETRRLNLMQLENPGAGLDVAPEQNGDDASYDDPDSYADESDDGDMNGQGGPYDPYDPDGDSNGPPPDTYSPSSDDSYAPDAAAPPYPGDDSDGDYLDDDGDGSDPDDDE